MKKFSIDKLPNDVKERIDQIEWNDGYSFDDGVCGLVWIKEKYEFYDDGSHCCTFENRKDLIECIRFFTKESGGN